MWRLIFSITLIWLAAAMSIGGIVIDELSLSIAGTWVLVLAIALVLST